LKLFGKILKLGFTEIIKQHYPVNRPYTWWYSSQFFDNNEGYHIDHFLVHESFLPYVIDVKVLKEFRAYD
jgi:exonuclease III